MHAHIAVLPGDGIGKEVTVEGVKVLSTVASVFGHKIEVTEALIGGVAIDATGSALPDETLTVCRN
ncbi:MAG TPA: isocitrate/isopropylmalate family dehydrogenase, partial [Chloroflexota bacterium]|nr:isocitrate/isopropylmalate family dehydrogenase [Chloroflexota bacterium]